MFHCLINQTKSVAISGAIYERMNSTPKSITPGQNTPPPNSIRHQLKPVFLVSYSLFIEMHVLTLQINIDCVVRWITFQVI